MSTFKKVTIASLVFLVLIQFLQPAKNVSAEKAPDDLFVNYAAPDSIQRLVKTACYDCHSNNTNYPWYSRVQPLAWWLNHHIEEGKGELNFSDFAAFNARFKSHKLDEVMDLVKAGEMPLKSYTLAHSEADLSPAQRDAIVRWADDLRNQIKPREN